MSSYYLQVQSMDVFKDVFKGKLSSPNQGQNLMSNVNVEIYGIDNITLCEVWFLWFRGSDIDINKCVRGNGSLIVIIF